MDIPEMVVYALHCQVPLLARYDATTQNFYSALLRL
jgi:hypothetical protein